MDDVEISDLQKKATHFESQYNKIKTEFKEFIETTRKNEDLKKNEIQSNQAKKVLTVADSLCRIGTVVSNNSCDPIKNIHENYKQNIDVMYQQLLSSSGLTCIDPTPGAPFDDEVCMAVGLEYGSRYPEDTVYSVIRRGYKRDNVLIRPAEVIISKRPREEVSLKKVSPLTSLIHFLFPSRQKIDQIDLLYKQIDQIEHARSETTIRLEAEIHALQETISQLNEENEELKELKQIVERQSDGLIELDDEVAGLKSSLSQYGRYIEQIENQMQMYADQLKNNEELKNKSEYPETAETDYRSYDANNGATERDWQL